MFVYRVENAECHGPYIGREYDSRVDTRDDKTNQRHANMKTHPCPSADGLFLEEYDYCAFDSMDKLQKWFKGDIRWLKMNKFHVSVYEIEPEKVKVGRRQVLFQMRYANLVNITDFRGNQL